MNDNLPEINFKEKKEKKGGALGWLRGKFGGASRGAMGEAGINPSAMNLGRGALGAGKFGASTSGGLAGLLAGKAGIVATIAMVAVAGGVYVANNSPAPSTSAAAFNSGRTPDNYVPAILRSQAANGGSSLDMFKETNKGAVAMEGDTSKAKAPDAGKPADAAAEGQAADPNAQPGADQAGGMAQEMMGKLQGGSMGGSLTSQLGGGSSKFSNMGGFSNKFGSGASGGKPGFSSGIGSGFSSMPKFDSRKGKMLSMKGSPRPVFGGAKSGKKGALAPGAFGQAKGMKAMQQSYSGSSIDSARSTQDKAWEGSTGEGDASAGGAGLSEGGAGLMTSPSLDNAGTGGGGGGTGTPAEPVIPEPPPAANVSPWGSLTTIAMMLILMAALLAGIGAKLINMGDTMIESGTALAAVPYTAAAGAAMIAAGTSLRGIGMALAGVALALGIAATIMGIMIMQQHGQSTLGTLYTIGGGCATAAAGMALAGVDLGPITPAWMAAGAGAIALIGSMLGGK
ncbi:MAG: hypothetical protein A2X32_11960 [Elusimicrobia bacterium GWC2_64_44]|nr:MAG: hypothetical protein A2X32_11960 [Elusimicrobia bacterium GWC2_64_44]